MKTNIIFLLLFFYVHKTFGQLNRSSSPLDSLKQELASSKSDTERVLILEKLMWVAPNKNTSIEYGQQGIALAKRIHYYKGMMVCGNALGFFFGPNDYYNAITILTDTKQLAEKQGNEYELALALGILGYAYSFFDFETSLQYFHQCKILMDKINMSEDVMPIYSAIGFLYEEWGPPDSALLYIEKGYQHDKASKNINPGGYYMHLGKIYYKKKQIDLALNYFRSSLAYGTFDESYLGIAEIYRVKGSVDSATYYAKKALGLEQQNNSAIFIIRSADLLFNLYKTFNPPEALKYHLIASAAKDSLFSQEKAKHVAKLVFQEREKEARTRQKLEVEQLAYQNKIRLYLVLGVLSVVLLTAIFLYRNNLQKQKNNAILLDKNEQIKRTLQELKSTQAQLIQSEKMASLGELTAGIAHEIQNPLNFVNNFSEVNKEMIDELQAELKSGNTEEAIAISNDIKDNEEKINHHGRRADAIVKGMLQHSRNNTGQKELTDINALADEYLRLSYQGLRAKDKNFNADYKTDFDESIGKVNVIPQDIGRVLLNLYNNAFYAVNEKKKANTLKGENFKPTVLVTTKFINSPSVAERLEISVRDNGDGISQKAIDKIFQPFFTTKPTGQGTGLGLSLSYDIIKAHNGELKVESKEGEGTIFIIKL